MESVCKNVALDGPTNVGFLGRQLARGCWSTGGVVGNETIRDSSAYVDDAQLKSLVTERRRKEGVIAILGQPLTGSRPMQAESAIVALGVSGTVFGKGVLSDPDSASRHPDRCHTFEVADFLADWTE